jgi:hypothetical protein
MLLEKDRVLDTPIMRNIHARERETIMMGGFIGGGRSYHEPERYTKEQEKEQELSKLSEQTGLSEQELSRLKTTTAQRVFRVLYTAFGVALLLLLIVFIVGVNVFHW